MHGVPGFDETFAFFTDGSSIWTGEEARLEDEARLPATELLRGKLEPTTAAPGLLLFGGLGTGMLIPSRCRGCPSIKCILPRLNSVSSMTAIAAC